MFECSAIELRSYTSFAYYAVCTFIYDGNETLGDIRTVTEGSALIIYKAFINHNRRVVWCFGKDINLIAKFYLLVTRNFHIQYSHWQPIRNKLNIINLFSSLISFQWIPL